MTRFCFCAVPAKVGGLRPPAAAISDVISVVSTATAAAFVVAAMAVPARAPADAEAYQLQHPDLPAVIIDATTEAVAMAEAGATRGPPRDDKHLS